MKNSSLVLIKRNIFSFLIYPQFYVCAIILTVFSTAYFFVASKFFIRGAEFIQLENLFSIIPYIFVLIIPLLCTKFDSGFENSLPVSTINIVFCRWISCCIALLLMLLPVIAFAISLNFFTFVDFGQIFTGFFILSFYAFASAAFSNFIFVLIKHAYVAVSFVCLAITASIHSLLFYVETSNLLAAFVHFFSFKWHFDSAQKGIFDTREFLFFVISIIFFCTLSAILIEKRKGCKNLGKLTVIFLIFCTALFANSMRFFKRFDLTKNKRYTVSSYSKKLISDNLKNSQTEFNAHEKIRITFYQSKTLKSLYPQVKNIEDFLNEYGKLSKNITITTIKFDENSKSSKNLKEIETKRLNTLGIQPQQIKIIKNNEQQFTEIYSAIVIEYLDEKAAIPFVLSDDTLEYDLDCQILKLLTGKERFVYLVNGSNMDFSKDFSYIVPWLSAQGLKCLVLTPEDLNFSSGFLDSADTSIPMAIFGSAAFSEEHTASVETFILKGGKVFAAVSPYSVDINATWSVKKEESPFLQMLSGFGFNFSDELIAGNDCVKISMISNDSKSQKLDYPYWIYLDRQDFAPNGMTGFWLSPLIFSKENIKPILKTKSDCTSVKPIYSGQEIYVDTNPFTAAKNISAQKKQAFTVAAVLNGKAQGIFTGNSTENAFLTVLSNQYFASTLLLGYAGGETGDYRNLQVLSNFILQIRGESELAQLLAKSSDSHQIFKINQEKLSAIQTVFMLIFMACIPLAFIFLRLAVCIRRKNISWKFWNTKSKNTEK